MLKKLSFILIVLYLSIQYGQNFLEFGSDLRIDFYFTGMSLVQLLGSFMLFKAFKNVATSFYLFVCIGAFINELYFNGLLNYVDIFFGLTGIVYILVEKK